tara:strand:- start:453 stop:773 length:321 start_codon:yes stop_codon:yes gene_type:complete
MSYILFATTGGVSQPITLTADIDADDFSINNVTNLTAGTTGIIIGSGSNDIGFFGNAPSPQGVLNNVGVSAMPLTYDNSDLDFAFTSLVDGINGIILQLQTLGLTS